MTVKRRLVLEGLDCAHCASKIECEVRNLKGVSEASLNFSNGTLAVEAESHEIGEVIERAGEIIRRHEPDIVVSEKRADAVPAAGVKPSARRVARLAAAGALLLAAVLLRPQGWAGVAAYMAGYLLAGAGVLWAAARNLARGKLFDENFLMGAATIGAFAIGEYPEAVAVMVFYQVGELFQEMAVNRSRKSIGALLDIRPDTANRREGEEVRTVPAETVRPGQWIVVRPGERVPLDGVVREGRSALDLSALTGEARPADAAPGDAVLSGSVNLSGLLTVEVTKEYGESTVSKILELVQNAGSRKAPAENFITKFARYYTPAVVFAALALALLPPLFTGWASFALWLNRALIFLVVSCPCALVISIPLSFFGGIGAASRRGILVKGGNYLDALNRVDTVVFDKTGTLTRGVFTVTSVEPANGFTEAQLVEWAALAESHSTHPIARSVLRAYGKEPDRSLLESVEELPGLGVRAVAGGREILAGNARLLAAQNVNIGDMAAEAAGAVVHVAVDGAYAGRIVIADELKPDARAAIDEMRRLGVRRVAMLTGDGQRAAEAAARELGIDEVRAGLLPAQKVEAFEEMAASAGRGGLLFVGDGINDAPVLARADVGVAMGALGSDAAIEAADVVLMTDEPMKLAEAMRIARRTRAVVTQNILFALGVKAAFLLLGALGVATMWEAVFADVGVALIAVLNAMRVMRVKSQ